MPDSVSWRVNREVALVLAGGRALLMQIAHPSVAAGVLEHSNWNSRPLNRLLRTLDLFWTLNFGDRRQVLETAQAINRTHRRVRGAGYTAQDPRLLLWVHATLIDSALVAYEAFVGKLTPAEKEEYLCQTRRVGALLGVEAGEYPRDMASFRRYLAEMLETELRVDEGTRELGRAVLSTPLRFLPDAAMAPLRAAAVGLLPPELREAYGMPWGRPQRALLASMRWAVPRLLPVLPGILREAPPARAARRRLEAGHALSGPPTKVSGSESGSL